ncbi:MAG: DUF1801 domain-containing protein [Saprospiraceae bacterium]
MKDIDQYIADFPEEIQERLQIIRKAIKEEVPEGEEAISYQIPTFKFKKKNLVHFAGFKNHIGFYPTPRGIEEFEGELSKYKQGKGSVQFPHDQDLPMDLIRRMVRFLKAKNG